ncbi:MAG: M56 family metallopeptidase [Roseibacillus sp.]
MTDLLFQIGLSNACFALLLALVAMLVGAKGRRPHLAHLLWLLVFVKLVTPPLVTLPVLPSSALPEAHLVPHSMPEFAISEVALDAGSGPEVAGPAPVLWRHGKAWLVGFWLAGSLLVFAWSLFRVGRFQRLLSAESAEAPDCVQAAARGISKRLGLKTIPRILTTSAHLSPMVWWTGGRVRVVIPSTLLETMSPQEWQWVLSHELAHVRRRDYFVRWLEWLACVLFWWNPVMWWAQRKLRAAEEICCDALVLSAFSPKPQSYANSILTAVETLACPALRPPAMASEINSGGSLEHRMKMIIAKPIVPKKSRFLHACVVLGALTLLPLGLASARDYEAVQKRLQKSVKKGDLTQAEAKLMMEALKKSAGKGPQKKWSLSREEIGELGKKIRAAVAAGEMTEEEGRKKMAALLEGYRAQGESGKPKKMDAEGFRRRLGAAVEAGKMTREEAAEKMAGFWGRGSDEWRVEKLDWERIRKRIEGAVEDGKISRQEADAKYREIKKRASGAEEREGGNREADLEARYDKLIKDNPSLKEVPKERLMERLRASAGKGARDGDKERGRERSRERKGERGREVDWESIKERIEGAVKEGKISREQADANYRELKKRASEVKRREEVDLNALGKRLHDLVEAGKLSKEDARAKLEALRKRAASKDAGETKERK